MHFDDITNSIAKLISDEVVNFQKNTELILSCRPPCLDRSPPQYLDTEMEEMEGVKVPDIEFRCINLRKIVMAFLDERQGSVCPTKEEVDWHKAWAKEFEMYAKKLRKQAEDLDARIEVELR